MHPAQPLAQAFLAAFGRAGADDGRRVLQMFAVAGASIGGDEFVVDARGGVLDAVEQRFLEVDRRQRGAQHLVVVNATVARLEKRAAFGAEHLQPQPSVGGRRRLEVGL